MEQWDDWVRNARSRRQFMRASGIVALAELLLGSTLPTADALAILATELRVARPPPDASGRLARDAGRVQRWIEPQLARARGRFGGLAVLLGEEDVTFDLDLALTRRTVPTGDWTARDIVLRAPRSLRAPASASLLIAEPVRSDGIAHLGPLAAVGLLVRDALSAIDARRLASLRSVEVRYTDGDRLRVSWPLAH